MQDGGTSSKARGGDHDVPQKRGAQGARRRRVVNLEVGCHRSRWPSKVLPKLRAAKVTPASQATQSRQHEWYHRRRTHAAGAAVSGAAASLIRAPGSASAGIGAAALNFYSS